MKNSTSDAREPALRGDTKSLHEALVELIRVYQFRDRDRICCHDLSVSQYYALDALVRSGPLTLNELAATLYLEKSSASRVMDGLEEKGHALRRPHPADGRALLLEPTPRGRALHRRILDAILAEERALLEDFAPEVRSGMVRLVRGLADAASSRVLTGDGSCCRIELEPAGVPERDIDEIRTAVRERYGEAARRAECGDPCGCGTPGSGRAAGNGDPRAVDPAPSDDPITRDLYSADDVESLPQGALAASLGSGNPAALAELREGETVLDLGSGGGIDVLLSARRVGPEGQAYGLDMTDEMLELARRNAREAGQENVEFLKGHIEDVPLPDASVDVIISNCVINLSGDKPRVLTEAFRVLKPGGRFAVSDIVVRDDLPEAVRRSREAWAGCIAGALEESEFRTLLRRVGFEDVEIEPTREYGPEEVRDILADQAGLAGGDDPRVSPEELAEALAGKIVSAFVRARKPGQDEGKKG